MLIEIHKSRLPKTLIISAVIVASIGVLLSTSRPATDSDVPMVAGVWKLTNVGYGGGPPTVTGTMILLQQGHSISGTGRDEAAFKIKGEVKPPGIYLTKESFVGAGKRSRRFLLMGTIDKDLAPHSLQGTAYWHGECIQPAGTWIAERLFPQ